MNILRTDNTIDPNNAAKKPSTANPGTSLATSKNIRALITNVNNPNVSRLIGRVKISNIGLIEILIIPITKADQKAAAKPVKLIPGIIQAVKSNAKAKSIHLISRKSILFLSI